MTSKTHVLVILSLLGALASGCMATFATREPERRTEIVGRPSLHVAVTSEALQLNNGGDRSPFQPHPEFENDVLVALRSCDCYAAVVPGVSSEGLQASVRVRQVVQHKAALLNLVTAYLVPAIEDRQFTVQALVRDPETNQEATAERSRDFRVWYELLFLPLYPFASPAAFETDLLHKLIRESVAEALGRLGGPSV